MTKKEFVLNVIEQLLENPRKVLAGHGIKAAVLQTILKRPDVMAKLANVLYSLKTAKKGAVGLKKSSVFQIKGYKNFAEMNLKAREDIENFVAGLSDADAEKFNNTNNVCTVLMLPDKVGMVSGDEGDDVVEGVITGKSVLVNFDTAVRKEYKVSGGSYLVIMIADSAVRPAEEKLAKRKKSKNSKLTKRRTPARLKAELKKKANKKLELLKAKRVRLQDDAYALKAQMAQDATLAGIVGDEDITYGVGKRNMQASNYQINRNAALAGLSDSDKAIFASYQKLMNRGNKAAARALRSTLSPQAKRMLDLMSTDATIATGDSMVAARKAAVRKEIKRLTSRNEQLLLDLSLAPAEKRLSIKSMISKNTAKIRELQARLGTYKNGNAGWSTEGRAKKKQILDQLHADIQANIAEGESISQALNTALAAIDATPQQKQQLKTQIVQQVADGMPMQYAVQQAVQQQSFAAPQNDTDFDLDDDTTLTGSMTINEILDNLV